MPEPHPFLPLWRLLFRGQSRKGKGLLPTEVVNDVLGVEDFSVGPIRIIPRTGQMFVGSLEVSRLGPSRLLWFRRMQFQMGTHDENHGRPDCLWYGAGLQNAKGKWGYQLFEDGHISDQATWL